MNDIDLLHSAETAIEQSCKLANTYFSTHFLMPSVSLNQRGKIAGSAHLQKNVIKLNKKLFIQNFEDFLYQVIPHEVAHIICYQKFGKVKPHGIEWQRIMRSLFNLDAHVTHKYNVADVGMQEFAYRCDCNKLIMLSTVRHNKVSRGKQRYRCQKCKTVLTCAD
ncbi:MAG: SprT protein [Bermanella sp.]|jgi:SprT protein|uniref:SprT family zinc-dependent metalloprotease n=1 Tax=Glaciecola sp. 33A TaxID=2057807 RepID=UPI000C33477F|nr:SprT family zinc-dependent metalloprotease [Glaciecola sp. 33A]PKH99970.1 SprT family zinc-dependent metalloprotease [Glaciecola sp. 33A]